MKTIIVGFKVFPEHIVVFLYDDCKMVLEIFIDPTREQIGKFLISYSLCNKCGVDLFFPNLYQVYHTKDPMIFDERVCKLYGIFGADVDGDVMNIANIVRRGGCM